ncbi:MAG: TonB-dependent receptor [Pseudomonadota bacterium]|nr:TonB-dependent receptor [Pseudomonadota bacterium]
MSVSFRARSLAALLIAQGISGTAQAQTDDDLDFLLTDQASVDSTAGQTESPESRAPLSEGQGTAEPDGSSETSADNGAATASRPADSPTTPETADTIAVEALRSDAAPEVSARSRAKPTSRLLEEIVVTAQKREDNIQDVPISIQAFGGGALEAKNVQSTEELGELVPSLRFTEAAGYTLIYMRGIGTSQFVPSADPSIATYIDGIYVPQGQAAVQALGNVERVEVLKGPQGTLFGRNTIGGAINIITRDPADEFLASASLSYSDLDYATATAAIEGPVADWLSVSVSGAYSRNENYLTGTNFEVPDGITKTARVKLAFYPSNNLTLGLTGYYSRLDNVQLSIGKNTEAKPLGTLLGIQAGEANYTVDNDLPAQSESEQKILYGNLTWNLPWLDFKVLGSVQEINIPRYDYDFDGSASPFVGFDTTNQYTHAETGEIQFVSNDQSWMADRLKWIVGLYYYHSIGAFDPARFRVAPGLIDGAFGLAGLSLPPALRNFLDLLPVSNTPLGDEGTILALRGILETDSYSVFAQGTYTILDWLDLTLGGRFQYEDRFLTKAETNLVSPDGQSETTLLNFALEGTTESNFSPKAQISVRPDERSMIYASYAKGFKSGTYNIVNIYLPPDYIVPEEVSSYEIGAKVDFFGGDLRINGAVFYNDIKNLQDGFVSLLSGGAVSFNTAPGAKSQGVEFDTVWVPMPSMNPGLVLTAHAAYVEAIYTDFPNGEGFREDTGLYSGNLDLSGFDLRNSPKVSGGIGFLQTILLDSGSIEFGADTYYNGGFFYNANNTVEEAPYSTTSARVSYEYAPWKLRLTLFGQNVFDRRHFVQKFETDFGLLTTLAAPRQIGLRLNLDF